jgi:hypothetical protein
MMRTRPDWCVSRQRNWGVPLPFFLHRETGAPHPRTAELIEAVAQRVEEAGIEAWFALDPANCSAPRPTIPQDERHARRLVRLRLDARERAARLAPQRTRVSGRSLPRRLRSASRLVPEFAADRLRAWTAARRTRPADARLRRRRQGPEDVEVEGQRDRAAEDRRHARRRDPPPVGRRHRLLGRTVDLRRDSQARRRGLPPHPQHAALPARQHLGLRPGARHAGRSSNGWRSTATRWP